ncbi:hypothetical protein Q8A67_023849 [Cirrhinus molitorella]|uniref:Uncharacterized protein n=1 Tax=Cirrhinus molitorella TaxID=172907 RepID=A0AA88P5I9_9TELE|nr:hypothetical protein Q8A67_023849 [Cirrhinus molitorella]
MSATLQSDEARHPARLSAFSSSEQLMSDAIYRVDTSSPQWITAHDTTSLSIKGRCCQRPDSRQTSAQSDISKRTSDAGQVPWGCAEAVALCIHRCVKSSLPGAMSVTPATATSLSALS